MEETRTLNIDLQTAKEWFQKGGDWRKLALTAYSEDEINPLIAKDYENILEKFKKNYPIGSIVWNVDGTDNFPNIILSEPWLENSSSIYNKNGKYVVFKSARLYVYGDELLFHKIKLSDWNRGFDDGYMKDQAFVFEEYRRKYMDNLSSDIKRREEDMKACLTRAESDREEIQKSQSLLDNFDTIYNKLVEEAKKHYEHGNNKADNR